MDSTSPLLMESAAAFFSSSMDWLLYSVLPPLTMLPRNSTLYSFPYAFWGRGSLTKQTYTTTLHNVRKCTNLTDKEGLWEDNWGKDVSHVPCPEDCKLAWRVLYRTPEVSEGPNDGSSCLYPGIPNRWFLEDCLDTHKPLETPENVR